MVATWWAMDQVDWLHTSADERLLSRQQHSDNSVMGFCDFWVVVYWPFALREQPRDASLA